MTTAKDKELVAAYLSGDVSEGEKIRVEDYIAEGHEDEVQAQRELLGQLVHADRRESAAVDWDSFTRGVMDGIAAESRPQDPVAVPAMWWQGSKMWIAGATLAAAAALALVALPSDKAPAVAAVDGGSATQITGTSPEDRPRNDGNHNPGLDDLDPDDLGSSTDELEIAPQKGWLEPLSADELTRIAEASEWNEPLPGDDSGDIDLDALDIDELLAIDNALATL